MLLETSDAFQYSKGLEYQIRVNQIFLGIILTKNVACISHDIWQLNKAWSELP